MSTRPKDERTLLDAHDVAAIWLACERGEIAWTPTAPILWTHARTVTWEAA